MAAAGRERRLCIRLGAPLETRCKRGRRAERRIFLDGINGLASPFVWWAIVLIIASFITWLYVLRYIPLSFAYPLSRLAIFCSVRLLDFLGGSMSPLRWCGIALVVFGLALVAQPIARRNACDVSRFPVHPISLVTFVAAQLLLESDGILGHARYAKTPYFVSRVAIGVFVYDFLFLTLGLLQRFDLSYLYPFQGLRVIFITILAAVVLRKNSARASPSARF